MAKSISVALILIATQFKAGIASAKSSLKSFQGETQKSSKALQGFFAIGAAGLAIRGIVNTTRQIEELRGAFTTVTGDSAKSAAEFERVRQLSIALGTDANALAETYVKLAGAGISPTNGLLTTFVDMSKNATDQMGALNAIADLFSRTTAGGLGLEDLNRLQDRGIAVFAILEEQLGLSRLELSKLGQTAEGARKIQAALYEGFKERFAGTSLRELGSINSQLMIFQTLSRTAQESFGKGLIEAIARSVGTVGELGNGINALATSLGQALGNALVFIIDNLNIIVPVITAFGAAWAAVKVFQVAQGLMAIVMAVRTLTIALAANPIGLIAVGVAALIAGFIALVQQTGSVSNAIKSIGNAGIAVVNTLISAWLGFNAFISTLIPAIASAIADGLNPFSDGSFNRTLSSGFSRSINAAKAEFGKGGPIRFRFQLDPVQRSAAPVFDPNAGGLEYNNAARASNEEASKAADEAAKDLERREELALRNLQTVRENIAQLQVETTLMGERLSLDLALVGVAEDYAEQKNKQFDLDKARDKLIADIQAKELSTDPAENARLQAEEIAKVNTAYARQSAELGKLIEKRVKLINLDAETKSTQAIAGSLEENALAFTRIANLTKAFEFEKEYNLAVAAARNKARTATLLFYQQNIDASEAVRTAELARINSVLADEEKAAGVKRDLAKMEFDAARTYAVGIAQAQNEAMLRLTDNAQIAKDMFNMAMNGFSDAILNFVETGKLSFKDLFKSLMAELIKLQAQKLFLQLFGDGTAGNKGGVVGSIFSGIFKKRAVGGPVMAGTPYVVGERGPELFVPSGPGTVVANDRMGGGGVTQVVYNINAVDALSFKQLVARDPEFIYSVSQAGARRLPR
jgi:hypothetical protein